jgi:hypothetical protein
MFPSVWLALVYLVAAAVIGIILLILAIRRIAEKGREGFENRDN